MKIRLPLNVGYFVLYFVTLTLCKLEWAFVNCWYLKGLTAYSEFVVEELRLGHLRWFFSLELNGKVNLGIGYRLCVCVHMCALVCMLMCAHICVCMCLALLFCCCCCCFFWDRVFLYIPGCPGTHFVDQAGLELRNLPALASRVLGLKSCATTSGLALLLKMHWGVTVRM